MLIDYEYIHKNLICSYIDEKGNIKLKHYPWQTPTRFITTSTEDREKSEDYVTWDGKAVKEIYSNTPNKYSVYYFLESLPEEEQKIIWGFNEPNIFFVDIETEILDEKPKPELAKAKILSLSIVHKDKALCMGVDPLTKEEIKEIQNEMNTKYGIHVNKEWTFQYICYKNEYDMLYNFFNQFVPKMSVITGWNFIGFDWVYLVNRFRNIGGDPSVASFTKKLKAPKFSKNMTGMNGTAYKTEDLAEIPYHRIVIDYMDLYKKWDQSVKVKESATLDFVAGAILGDKFGKVSYTGDLKLLYKSNKKQFIFYNLIDSILVQLIHEKTKLIDILYGISCLSHTTVLNSFSTLAVTEGILRNKLKTKKNIILVKDDLGNSEISAVEGSVSGGFVLPPVKGLANWTVCYDFSSLYPTTIREFNISADSYKGQVPMIRKDGLTRPDPNAKYSIFNGHQIPLEPNDIILLSGSVFRNEEGIVSQVMREIFADRKKYKKMSIIESEKLEELKKIKQRVLEYSKFK